MRWRPLHGVLIASGSIFLALAGCGQSDGSLPGTATGTTVSTPSPVSSVTATPLPTAVPTATPASSPTPESPRSVRVDALVCERLFPGVPNPDGPNEWLNVSGTVTNVGALDIVFASVFASTGPPVVVDLLDLDGRLLISLEPKLANSVLPAGQAARFEADRINAEHPSVASCRVRFNLDEIEQALSAVGKTEAEVTIFAAP